MNATIGIPSGWETIAAYHAGMYRGATHMHWSGLRFSGNFFYLQVKHDWRVDEEKTNG